MCIVQEEMSAKKPQSSYVCLLIPANATNNHECIGFQTYSLSDQKWLILITYDLKKFIFHI